MGINGANVVIVTISNQFYSALTAVITKEVSIGSVILVSNILQAESKLLPMRNNVLILDLDKGTNTHSYLQQLCNKFRLMIILTGTTKSPSYALLKDCVKHFVLKPRTFDTASIKKYLNEVTVIINPFLFQSTVIGTRDLTNTITENHKIVAIASSTGGTEVLEKMFRSMPSNIPPILVVQHMPSGFTKLFAERLNNFCPMVIKEATNGDFLKTGQVLIAPADSHMKLIKQQSRLAVECFVGTKVHGVMPAADVLFDSIAPIMKSNAIGVVLTGMGADGSRGLLKMHMAGAKTICQDKNTSVVYGMPKAAYELGAVDFQLPMTHITEKVLQLAK